MNKLMGLLLLLVGSSGLLGAGWLFVSLGLDKGDKLASVAGLFVGLLSLLVAIYGLAKSLKQKPVSPIQAVTDSSVGGNVMQAYEISGPVKIRRNTIAGSTPLSPSPASASTGPESEQYVRGSQISGNIDQVHKASEVDLEG